MLTPKARRNIARIIPFGVIWLVFSMVYIQLERGMLDHLTHYPSTGNPYNFIHNLVFVPTTSLIAGLLMGAMEVLYFNKLFSQKSFSRKIIYKTIIYLGIIFLVLLVLTVINADDLNSSLFDKQVWHNVWTFFGGYAFLSTAIYMASVIVVSLFYIEVSENLGQGVLYNFFTGKYHTPKEEERIFMFLDMKSSTTIAERLGHVKYFEILREYYSDLSDPVIRHSGEIYQYVGDEIIVSWTLKNGLRKNSCIECFFALKEAIKKQTGKYHDKFGLLPAFKAAFHVGKVTTGEIGALKKEIIFTGDVLNTTARIQGLCNIYEVDILVSGNLIAKLNPNSRLHFKTLGENELRGRGEKIELFTILLLS